MKSPFACYLTISCLFSIPAFAADGEFPGDEALMTTEELEATGVGSLSGKQLESLNSWLERFSIDEITAVRSSEAAVLAPRESAPPPEPVLAAPAPPESAPEPEPAVEVANAPTPIPPPDDGFRQSPEKVTINSSIAGEFNGWTGRTRFQLQNGQIWEQRRGRRWKITLDSPEVRITQNFMGAYEMEVVSESKSIGVRRIR